MKLFLMMIHRLCADDPQSIDLSSLGMSDFNPYIFERESLWILLPAISLLFVFLHLKHYSPLGRQKSEPLEDRGGPENLL